MICLRVIVHGRVQGVGYRAWTVRTASTLGIKGWVRNRSDGTVEAVFHGDETQVEKMLDACNSGPMMARVDIIDQFDHREPVPDTFSALTTL